MNNNHTSMLEKRASFLEAAVGPNDPGTLEALADLALDYDEQGESARACQLQRTLVDRYNESMGAEAFPTVEATARLASYLFNAGSRVEALALCRNVAEWAVRKHGLASATSIWALSNVAAILESFSDFAALVKIREDLLAAEMIFHGRESPATLRAMEKLRDTRRHLGEFGPAAEMSKEMAEVLESLATKGDKLAARELIAVGTLMAQDMANLGDWNGALERIRKTALIARREFPPHHPVLRALNKQERLLKRIIWRYVRFSRRK